MSRYQLEGMIVTNLNVLLVHGCVVAHALEVNVHFHHFVP